VSTRSIAAYGQRVQEDAVRRRVEAFVADYHQRWLRAGQNPSDATFGPSSFDAWRAEVEALDATHGVPGWRSRYEGSLSMHPTHDPATERLDSIEVDGDRATAHSVLPGHVVTHLEYRLRRLGDDWRLARIVTSISPPGVPLLDDATAEALLARATYDVDLPPLPEHLALDVALLFTAGRTVDLFAQNLTTDVHVAGSITLASGVITVVDLATVHPGVALLARRVAPGTYPVEVAKVGSTNVALRLLLSDAPVAEHRVAAFTDGTTSVSVDAGNVALVDGRALVTADAQHIEATCQEEIEHLSDDGDANFALGGASVDAVLVTSGFGDGGYPTYWGLDARGGLAELVVDFVVLAENVERTTRVPFLPGQVDHPDLAAVAIQVAESGGGYEIAHRGTLRWRVLGPDDSVLVDSGRLGSFVTGGVSSSTWRPVGRPAAGAVLEVTEHVGYRHV
jgi:Protein of unknown function (DUF4241)